MIKKTTMVATIILIMVAQLKANVKSTVVDSMVHYLRMEIISRDYKGGKAPDTMMLKVFEQVVGGSPIGKAQMITATRQDRKKPFHFDVKVDQKFGYFELLAKPQTASGSDAFVAITKPQFWEWGDSLKIKIDPRETSVNSFKTAAFSGNGSGKYTARYIVTNLRLPYTDSVDFSNVSDYPRLLKYEKRKLDVLEDFRSQMSDLSYNILKADICYENRNFGFHFVKEKFKKINASDKIKIDEYRRLFHSTFDRDFNFGISRDGLDNSEQYLQFLYMKNSTQTYIYTLGRDLNELFNTISTRTSGAAREALLVYFFTIERNTETSATLLNKAEDMIKEPKFKEALSALKSNIPGWKLADYTLTNDKGQQVRLSDFDDKVVLLDFWGAGCGACISFYKNTLSKVQDRLHGNKDFVVLSVSEDVSAEKWKEGLKSGKFTDDRSVHLYTNGKGRYDPLIIDQRMNALPSVIILGKGRKVLYFNTDELYEYGGLLSAVENALKTASR
jgi:Thiol-disulfide isomerase and thioredoxins